MPKFNEPKSQRRENNGLIAEEDVEGDVEIDERIELDFVEESAGDDTEEGERPKTPRSTSAPRSPDAEENVMIHSNKYKGDKQDKKIKNEPEEEHGLGPKTPPEGVAHETKAERITKEESRGTKRRHSSSSESSYSKSGSPPQSYKREVQGDDDQEELTVKERIRKNKETRLVRLREARSRHLGYEYIPLSKKATFPPQPYFKNPSYYPGETRDKKPPPPPPPAQKIQPLPGGRLPLVQRRSSPAPFGNRGRSPPPFRKRRTIVEETIRVTGRRSPPPLSRHFRSPPSLASAYRSSSNRSSSTSTKELGPQTLYPSRRDPYPLSYYTSRNGESNSSSRDRDYDGRTSSSYRDRGSSSSGSNGNSYIFTGTKYVPRPFIPPPPPGKKWNCPRRVRDAPYVPGEKKWRCPQREPDTPPRR